MTIEERKLTPAGQGNLQQIKLGIPVVEALNRMAEDPMGENEKLLLKHKLFLYASGFDLAASKF